jgi:hypothetical protein
LNRGQAAQRRVWGLVEPRHVVVRRDRRGICGTGPRRIGRISRGGHTFADCGRGGGRRAGRARGLRGVIAQPVEQGLKQELARGQPFDHTHRRAAAGARPDAPGTRGDGLIGRFGRRRDGQGLTTLGQFGGAAPRREEADVANPDEAFREDVEPPDHPLSTGRYHCHA